MKYIILITIFLLGGCQSYQGGLQDPLISVHKALSDYVLSTGYVPKKRAPRTTTIK